MRLVARFTIMTVALVVITATAVGLLTYRDVETAILPAELARLQENVQRLALEFDQTVAAARDDVAGFASAAAIAGIMRARLADGTDPEGGVPEAVWRERMARRWVGELTVKASYAQFRFIGAADGGREILRVDRSGPDGAIRVVPEDQLHAKGERSYFQETMRLSADAVYISAIDLHQEQELIEVPHVPMLRTATPVFAPNGERFGILIIDVDLRALFARLRQTGNSSGTVRIVNAQGDYLVHPDPTREFGFDLGRRHRVQDEFPEFAETIFAGQAGAKVVETAGGESVGLAFANSRPAGGPGVTIVELVPVADLLVAAEAIRQSSLTVGIAAAVGAALLAVWLARSLAGPLAELTDAVNAFAAGRPWRMRENVSGELGVLARTFSRMVDEVGAQARALRESEARYRGTLDRMMEGCQIIGRDWRYLYVNEVAARQGRRPAAELLGRTMMECHPGIEATPVFAAIQRCMAGGVAERMENTLAFPAGGAASFQLGIQSVPEGVFILSLDITEQQRAEAALRQSREEFKDLFDNAPIGYHEVDAQGRLVRINTAEADMLGYRVDELLGQFVWTISADEELSRRAVHEKLAGGTPLPAFERRFRRKDGSTFPVLIADRLVRREDGSVAGIRAIVQDITGPKRTEHALRDSEERFRFLNDLVEATRPLADPAQVMAVTARMLGEHLRASRCAYADVEKDGEAFTILHDYTAGCASTVGQYRLSLFGPRAVATLHRGQTLIIRNVEAELRPGEGAEAFQEIGVKAIITCPLVKDGDLRAMMAVHQAAPRDWQPGEIALVQDVVERCWGTIARRTAEEELRQLNVELEQRVVQRTAQLEAANQELEAFSYSVSHDLRAPLRTIDGFSQALMEDCGAELPEEGRRHLRTIRAGAQQMGELIDDLLTFSRLSRLPLTRGPVDMSALVRDVLEESRALREGRAIELRIGELAAGTGDFALLKQVWVNLLSNAVKYTGQRASAVIEVGCTTESGETVYFVRDNGTGFDMRYAGKLFGVFQRLHRAEDFEGTGVGLAIVQRVVHRHGGRIWAEAVVDHGATFFFTLEGTDHL